MKRLKLLSLLTVMILLTSICAFMLTGCGGGTSDSSADEAVAEDASTEETVSDGTTADDTAAADDQSSGDWNNITESPDIDISALGGPGGVDVDLTKLSSTMVYAVVNDMMIHPNNYIGKKVRMKGSMASYHDEEKDKTYYACLIKDATACCSQGIEFVTTDEYSVAEYPSDGEDVTVVGNYDLYEEDGYEYCVLLEAGLE